MPASLRFATNYAPTTGVAKLLVSSALMTDCGNYTAVAENPAGKVYSTTEVFVKEGDRNRMNARSATPDSIADDDVPLNRAKPPRVIHPLQSLAINEGEPAAMACKIDGFPRPKVSQLL